MRYIKSYKLFEEVDSFELMMSNIEDILLPVKDLYDVSISATENRIMIEINTQDRNIELDLDHLISYVVSNGYSHITGKTDTGETHLIFNKKPIKSKKKWWSIF